MDSTYSSTDTLHSRDFGDSDDRSASGSSASTSASASSQNGAGPALSTPVKAVLQTSPGHSNNGAGALFQAAVACTSIYFFCYCSGTKPCYTD